MSGGLSVPIPWWSRIRVRVLAFGILMSILPLLVLGAANLELADRDLQARVERQSGAHAREVAQAVAEQVGGPVTALAAAAGALGARFGGQPLAEQQRALYSLLRQVPALEDVALAPAYTVWVSRREITPPPAVPVPENLASVRYLGWAPAPDGRPLLQVAVPVPGGGALVARISLRAALARLSANTPGSQVLVVDNQGALVAHSDFSHVLSAADARASPAVQRLLGGAPAGGLRYRRPDGEPVLAGLAPIPALGWGVVTEVPLARARAPLVPLALRFAHAGAAIMAVAVGLSILFGLRFTRPIEALATALRRLEAGELGYQARGGDRDELGALVDGFNRMSAALAEREQMASRAAQQERLAAVGLLAAGVAHEVNNPLGIIAGYAQDLEDRLRQEGAAALAAGGELGEYLETIRREAARAGSITRGLLDFARPGGGPRQPVAPAAALAAAGGLASFLLRRAGAELHVAADPAAPPVAADPGHLQQVLVNLLTNAADALRDWYGRRTVTMGAVPEAGGTLFTVADTGPGVAPEHLPRVFDPFFTTKAPGQGTGLGLSVCYGLVRDLGGWIRLESEPGQGTRVLVWLPAAAPAEGGEACDGSDSHRR